MALDKDLELADDLAAGVVCPECDAFNPLGSVRCQDCGTELEITVKEAPPLPKAQPAEDDNAEDEITIRQSIVPPLAVAVPPAADNRRPTGSMPGAVAAPLPQIRCSHCQSLLAASAAVCPVCTRPVSAAGVPAPQAPIELSIRLRLCRGYGREDATYPIGPAGVTIGRAVSGIQIADDPYLSPRHCRVWLENGRVQVQDQGSLNGTFLRVRGRCPLKQGAEIVAGHQRLLVVGLGGPTTDPRLSAVREARVFGGPPGRNLYLALRMICVPARGAPLSGPVILRRGPLVTLGRKDCHLNFPLDGRLASPHAELHLRASGIELVVQGQTGVFVRMEGAAELHNGDEIMLGEEILRLEMN